MSAAARLHLKQPGGWFAAGREVQRATTLLSDGAFKLFVWLCLHAERTSGTVQASIPDLAVALQKGEREIAAHIEELIAVGVCRLRRRQEQSQIEIQDCFWPYERVPSDHDRDPSAYVAAVKRMFLQHACVQTMFTPADQKLAADWHRRSIPLQAVERAILLGTLRKYVALLNRGGGTPITSLHYFVALLDEIDRLETSADYWVYVAWKLRDLETRWRATRPNPRTNTTAMETK